MRIIDEEVRVLEKNQRKIAPSTSESSEGGRGEVGNTKVGSGNRRRLRPP